MTTNELLGHLERLGQSLGHHLAAAVSRLGVGIGRPWCRVHAEGTVARATTVRHMSMLRHLDVEAQDTVLLLTFRLLAMSFLIQGLSLGHLVSPAVQDERRLLTRSLPQGHLLAYALELLLQGLC